MCIAAGASFAVRFFHAFPLQGAFGTHELDKSPSSTFVPIDYYVALSQ